MQLEGLLDILTDAKEYGSILNVPEYNWALLRRFVDGIDMEGQISFDDTGVEKTAKGLQKLIDLGETMARKYWVAVTIILTPILMSILSSENAQRFNQSKTYFTLDLLIGWHSTLLRVSRP